MSARDAAKAGIALAGHIAPHLAGHSPDIQGAALAELVAKYFAGHCPDLREEIMTLWLATMRMLIKPNEDEILSRFGGQWPKRQ